MREFVKMRQEQEAELQKQIDAGEVAPEAMYDLPLPEIPYVCSSIFTYRKLGRVLNMIVRDQYQCRQIMTRPDFLEGTCTPVALRCIRIPVSSSSVIGE